MTENNLQSKIFRAIKPTKRRAVAEVISSLLLVTITVVGAILLTTFLDETFVAGSSSIAGSDSTTRSLQLLKYDTRDSTDLLQNTNLANKFGDDLLLGESAIGAADSIPEDDGTEFFVMQIKNRAIHSIFVENISVNGVMHDWDPLTAGKTLDASVTAGGGVYPLDGKFSVAEVPDPVTNPSIQKGSSEIGEGQIVNIFIKLSTDDTDIPLNKSIRVLFNIGASSPVEFIIESGDAK